VRFGNFGLGLTMGCFALNLTQMAIAATPAPAPVTQAPISDRLAIYDTTYTTIRGNGVEFKLPTGFKGGSPSSTQTQAVLNETAKLFPSMASSLEIFYSNPEVIRAIATDTDARQTSASMVLVTCLPIPASVSLAEIQEAMVKVIPSALPPEFKLVDNQVIQIGSRQIVRLDIDATIQGIKIKESIGFFKAGGKIFQVTYVYGNENADRAMPIFEQMISTFKATTKTAS
jgi:hypothetical protein